MVEPDSRRIVRVNRVLAEMLGYRPEELSGWNYGELTWPEDREADDAQLALHLAGETEAFFLEKRYRRRDGSPFWVRASSRVTYVANHPNHPNLVVATIEDIDARRRAEEALDAAKRDLAKSEAEFRASFEEAVVGKVMVEPVTRRIVRANRAFAEMLGYRPDELIGRTGLEITWGEDRDANEFELSRHLAGDSVGFVLEKRYMRRDGAPLWVRASARLVDVANNGDRSRLIFATIENIDGRRRAEDALYATQSALAKSEAEFRVSFEGAAVGKALIDPVSMCILRANRAYANMLGYEPEEIIGHTGAEYTPPEDIEEDARVYSRLRWGKANVFFREKRFLRRNGAPFWARVSVSLVDVPENSDHPRIVVATIEDIDAKHNAEVSLQAAKQDLEVVVEQRTAALDQRDVLLREVYHRVKNNLQIIDGMLMMQAMKLESARAKQALLSMRGRVQALGLVHQQLMGSADLKTFDIAPFLAELTNNILNGQASAGVNLRVDATPMAVGLDFAIPLGMLVNELVTNSLKHAFAAQEGNIMVALGPDAHGTVVLVVSDDCSGQSASATKRSRPGIGTAIIKGLVSQIGGTMLVRGGKGTTTEIRTQMRAPK
jgi:PAS domain S-box-containing protein